MESLYYLYRFALFQMSILVHPDKNPDDRERAQTAFDSKSNIKAVFGNKNREIFYFNLSPNRMEYDRRSTINTDLLFSVINKAYKALEDETTRKKCMDVVEEAKFKVDTAVGGPLCAHCMFASLCFTGLLTGHNCSTDIPTRCIAFLESTVNYL